MAGAVAAVLTGCVVSPTASPGNGSWRLEGVDGKTLVAEPVTVTVQGTSGSAHLGCNALSGTLRAGDGGRFTVVVNSITEMGCEPYAEVAEQERWLQEFLESGATSTTRAPDVWTLQADGVTLSFRKTA